MSDTLNIYTIYDHPKDYPNYYVVRRWTADSQERAHECQLASTLEEARQLIPAGCVRLVRQANDDPVIVENWL